MALPKENRLTSKKDIDRVFERGRTVKSSFLFIRFVNNEKKDSRYAFMVPVKYLPLAVDRNRVKRVFTDKISKDPDLLKSGYDVVVGVSKKIEKAQIKNLAEELIKNLSKI